MVWVGMSRGRFVGGRNVKVPAGQTGGYSLILRASGVEGVVADHPFTSKQRE
jgi:hypothetical protein